MHEISTFLSAHILLSSFAAVLLIFIIIVEVLRSKKNKVAINPSEVTHLLNHQNAAVLDIRPEDIFRKGHIINAILFASSDLKPKNKKLDKYKSKPIIIVCTTGNDSQKIAISLLKEGYNAYSINGGMRAWLDAQMPIVKE